MQDGRRTRSGVRRSLLVGVCLAGCVAVPAGAITGATGQGDAAATVSFSGSAAAGGVLLTVVAPGAPATDVPVDGGGPTAQVAVDSIGTSVGYAAFPDPGKFFVSVPGLAVGLLAGGAGGLPPLDLPSLPGYPFYVASDPDTAPEVSVGSGPYRLAASSTPQASEASATAGLETDVGNAALASSTASVAPSASGGVVAKATARLQGLSVGPLTIGQVSSTATQTMDEGGTITPSTDLEIAGMRVGNVPVALTPKGFVAGGETTPVAVNSSLADMLKGTGITVELVAPQNFPDRVVAPAIRISFPFAIPGAKDSGTATMIIGSATTSLVGAAATGAVDLPVGSGGDLPHDGFAGDGGANPSGTDGGVGTDGGIGSLGGAAMADNGDSAGSQEAAGGESGPSDATLPVSGGADQLVSAGSLPAATVAGGSSAIAVTKLDLRTVYLVVLLGALAVSAAGAGIRRLGVRA